MRRQAMTREQALKALELYAGASLQEIKQAYRDLALLSPAKYYDTFW